MAKLNSLFSFSGTLDGISVYPMDGVDKPVVRKKGGPSKQTVQTSDSCANQRSTGKNSAGVARLQNASGKPCSRWPPSLMAPVWEDSIND